jgi:hypothetical protein
MGSRSNELARKVEQAIDGLLAAVEASTPTQWSARCSDGEWTQAFAAYHAAMNIEPIAQTMKVLAEGGAFPSISMGDIDEENARNAREHAGRTRAETVALIRQAGPDAVAIVRGLSDGQLDVKVQPPAPIPETAVAGMIEMALVGHTAYHLGTIRAAR